MPLSPENLDHALRLLGELLAARRTADYDLVVCGGSALLAGRIVSRSTHDVDVLARMNLDHEVSRAHPLPGELTHRDRLPDLLNALGHDPLIPRFER